MTTKYQTVKTDKPLNSYILPYTRYSVVDIEHVHMWSVQRSLDVEYVSINRSFYSEIFLKSCIYTVPEDILFK